MFNTPVCTQRNSAFFFPLTFVELNTQWRIKTVILSWKYSTATKKRKKKTEEERIERGSTTQRRGTPCRYETDEIVHLIRTSEKEINLRQYETTAVAPQNRIPKERDLKFLEQQSPASESIHKTKEMYLTPQKRHTQRALRSSPATDSGDVKTNSSAILGILNVDMLICRQINY